MNVVAELLQHLVDVAPDAAHVVAEVRVADPAGGKPHVVRALHYASRSGNAYMSELDGAELRGWSSAVHALEHGIRTAVGGTQGIAAR